MAAKQQNPGNNATTKALVEGWNTAVEWDKGTKAERVKEISPPVGRGKNFAEVMERTREHVTWFDYQPNFSQVGVTELSESIDSSDSAEKSESIDAISESLEGDSSEIAPLAKKMVSVTTEDSSECITLGTGTKNMIFFKTQLGDVSDKKADPPKDEIPDELPVMNRTGAFFEGQIKKQIRLPQLNLANLGAVDKLPYFEDATTLFHIPIPGGDADDHRVDMTAMTPLWIEYSVEYDLGVDTCYLGYMPVIALEQSRSTVAKVAAEQSIKLFMPYSMLRSFTILRRVTTADLDVDVTRDKTTKEWVGNSDRSKKLMALQNAHSENVQFIVWAMQNQLVERLGDNFDFKLPIPTDMKRLVDLILGAKPDGPADVKHVQKIFETHPLYLMAVEYTLRQRALLVVKNDKDAAIREVQNWLGYAMDTEWAKKIFDNEESKIKGLQTDYAVEVDKETKQIELRIENQRKIAKPSSTEVFDEKLATNDVFEKMIFNGAPITNADAVDMLMKIINALVKHGRFKRVAAAKQDRIPTLIGPLLQYVAQEWIANEPMALTPETYQRLRFMLLALQRLEFKYLMKVHQMDNWDESFVKLLGHPLYFTINVDKKDTSLNTVQPHVQYDAIGESLYNGYLTAIQNVKGALVKATEDQFNQAVNTAHDSYIFWARKSRYIPGVSIRELKPCYQSSKFKGQPIESETDANIIKEFQAMSADTTPIKAFEGFASWVESQKSNKVLYETLWRDIKNRYYSLNLAEAKIKNRDVQAIVTRYKESFINGIGARLIVASIMSTSSLEKIVTVSSYPSIRPLANVAFETINLFGKIDEPSMENVRKAITAIESAINPPKETPDVNLSVEEQSVANGDEAAVSTKIAQGVVEKAITEKKKTKSTKRAILPDIAFELDVDMRKRIMERVKQPSARKSKLIEYFESVKESFVKPAYIADTRKSTIALSEEQAVLNVLGWVLEDPKLGNLKTNVNSARNMAKNALAKVGVSPQDGPLKELIEMFDGNVGEAKSTDPKEKKRETKGNLQLVATTLRILDILSAKDKITNAAPKVSKDDSKKVKETVLKVANVREEELSSALLDSEDDELIQKTGAGINTQPVQPIPVVNAPSAPQQAKTPKPSQPAQTPQAAVATSSPIPAVSQPKNNPLSVAGGVVQPNVTVVDPSKKPTAPSPQPISAPPPQQPVAFVAQPESPRTVTALRDQTDMLRTEVAGLRRENDRLSRNNEAMQRELATATTAVNQLKATNVDLEQRLQAIDVTTLQKDLTVKEATIKRLQATNVQLGTQKTQQVQGQQPDLASVMDGDGSVAFLAIDQVLSRVQLEYVAGSDKRDLSGWVLIASATNATPVTAFGWTSRSQTGVGRDDLAEQNYRATSLRLIYSDDPNDNPAYPAGRDVYKIDPVSREKRGRVLSPVIIPLAGTMRFVVLGADGNYREATLKYDIVDNASDDMLLIQDGNPRFVAQMRLTDIDEPVSTAQVLQLALSILETV